MRPLRIELSNFLSYRGEHSIDFTPANVIVLSGPNGSGKSSIPDAIRFALFGFTRGSTLDVMVSDGTENAKVAVTFGLDSRRFQATRSRRRGKSSTVTFGELHDDGGVDVLEPIGRNSAEAQAAILDLLGLDDTLFRMTAFVGQGDSAAFSAARPSERKDALGKVLILEEWAAKLKLARDHVGSIQSTRTILEGTKAAAAEVAEQVPRLREEVASHNVNVDALGIRVKDQEGTLATDREKRNALAERVATFEAAKARLMAAVAAVNAAREKHQATGLRVNEFAPLVLDADATAILDHRIKKLTGDEAKARSLAAARQQAADLDAAIAEASRLIAEAAAKYAREGASLQASLDAAIEAHRRDLAALQDRHAAHSRTAELLDKVPCPEKAPTIVAECLLLEDARKSSDALANLATAIEKLEGQDPGQDIRTKLEAHKRTLPSDPALTEKLERLRTDRAAVPWKPETDVVLLEELTKGLDELPTLREKKGNQERLAAALGEARKAHMAASSTLGELTETANATREAVPADPGPELQKVDARIETAAQTLRDTRSEFAEQSADLAAAKAKLGLAEKSVLQVKELEERDVSLLRRQKSLEVLVEAFGRDGIPALLVERAMPNLESIANDLLELLSDRRLQLRFETQAETQAGELRESLNIIVSDERGSRELAVFSGGERMRIDLAIRTALSALLATRKRSHCELLVLDETAAPLDQEGQDAFVESLDRIAPRFGLILAVTHLEDLKDRFPARLEVTKTAAGSRAELRIV